MTVINAQERFRQNDHLWVSLRRGGLVELSGYQSEWTIRQIMEAVAAKYPGQRKIIALAWDDKSCIHLEILAEADSDAEFKGDVIVDDSYYEVTVTTMTPGFAA